MNQPTKLGLSDSVHPSYPEPHLCPPCEDSGQELDGSPCLHCRGDSYRTRVARADEPMPGFSDADYDRRDGHA